MYARTFGATTQGVDGLIISVEVDSSNGLPAFDIVGLPSVAVRESKERVRTAIKNSGLRSRAEKITINLAPASIKKESAGLDLPIAVGLPRRAGCALRRVKNFYLSPSCRWKETCDLWRASCQSL